MKDLIFIPLMEKDFMSVTTWNHSQFPHFDADKVIDKMMKSKNGHKINILE